MGKQKRQAAFRLDFSTAVPGRSGKDFVRSENQPEFRFCMEYRTQGYRQCSVPQTAESTGSGWNVSSNCRPDWRNQKNPIRVSPRFSLRRIEGDQHADPRGCRGKRGGVRRRDSEFPNPRRGSFHQIVHQRVSQYFRREQEIRQTDSHSVPK